MQDYFASRRALIDDHLRALASRAGAPRPLAAPLQRALTSPGKRIRGILTLAAGESAGAKAEKSVDAAAAVGAMLANMSPAALGRIEVFAKNLGLAFQITDDILDVVATPEQLGKDVGKDANRLTFVKLAGVDGARKLSNELVDTSVEAVANLGTAAKPLRDLATLVRE